MSIPVHQLIQTPSVDSTPALAPRERDIGVAYLKMLGRLQSVQRQDVRRVPIDTATVCSTLLGVLRNIDFLRPQMENLTGFDYDNVSSLEDMAFALRDANIYFMTAAEAPSEYRAVVDEAAAIRATLRNDFDALSMRGLVPSNAVDDYSGLPGGGTIATDLGILVTVLQRDWAKIKGKCATTTDELDHAAQLAARLLRLTGERAKEIPSVSETADMRARALTLCLDAYDQIRRAVCYLRWNEDDADTIAPSLFADRRRPKTELAEETEPELPTPAQPVPPPATTPAVSPVPGLANSPKSPNSNPFMQ